MKIIKKIALVFLGLLIWIGIVYASFAFVKAEVNPFEWSSGNRSGLIFCIFCYIAFSPLIYLAIEELKE